MEKNYERLKLLRKQLGLSQSVFAEELGVTRSVIKNLELGVVEIKSYMFKLVAAIYHVNEDWLRSGEGEMFIKSENAALDELAEEYKLDGLSRAVVETFMELPEDKRQVFFDYAEEVYRKSHGDEDAPATIAEDIKKEIENETAEEMFTSSLSVGSGTGT